MVNWTPLFFAIGKTGYTLTRHQRCAIRLFRMAQHPGRMADGRHRFAIGESLLNKRDGMRIFRQIPQRTMAAGIKQGIKIFCPQRIHPDGGGQRLLRGAIGAKTLCVLGLRVRLITLRIQRRLARVISSPASCRV